MHFSRKTRVAIVTALAALLLVGWCYAPKHTTRAAIDVGSGSIKVTVAQIDPRSNTIKKILYAEEHLVPLKRDIQVGGKSEFSEKIQKVAIGTLADLRRQLALYRPDGWKGIATAASRQASNAEALYEKIREQLGMDIAIISQHEEGRLGFATAAAVSGVAPEQLIAVDSGSGSFQITTLLDGELAVIEGQLGYIPSLEALMQIRGKTLDMQTPPETVTLDEAKQLVATMRAKMPELPDSFLQKIQDPSSSIVGIGNENFIFAMGATGVGKESFTKEELWEAIERLAGKPAAELKQFSKPDTAVLGMVLLYTIMDAMHLDKLTSCYANGSCEGVLVDAGLWSEQTTG